MHPVDGAIHAYASGVDDEKDELGDGAAPEQVRRTLPADAFEYVAAPFAADVIVAPIGSTNDDPPVPGYANVSASLPPAPPKIPPPPDTPPLPDVASSQPGRPPRPKPNAACASVPLSYVYPTPPEPPNDALTQSGAPPPLCAGFKGAYPQYVVVHVPVLHGVAPVESFSPAAAGRPASVPAAPTLPSVAPPPPPPATASIVVPASTADAPPPPPP